jgi:hypothetical protein
MEASIHLSEQLSNGGYLVAKINWCYSLSHIVMIPIYQQPPLHGKDELNLIQGSGSSINANIRHATQLEILHMAI